MTRWRVIDFDGWAFDGPPLTLVYDGDDEATVSIIEQAAEDNGVAIERIAEEHEGIAQDYAESAE